MFTEVCNKVQANCAEGESVDVVPACKVLDMNENSSANSSVVYVEESSNGSVCSEGVDNSSEVGEILFEGRALVNSRDGTAGVQEEAGVCQLSSLGTILIGKEFEQILNLHLAMHDVVEEGLVIVNPREVFAQNRGGGVTNTSLPVGRVDWGNGILGTMRVGLQIGSDVLEFGIKRFVIGLSHGEMIVDVVDRSSKLGDLIGK